MIDTEPVEFLTANQQEEGPTCKECGCRHHYTSDLARLAGGRIRRRRVCRHCGHAFTTYERDTSGVAR